MDMKKYRLFVEAKCKKPPKTKEADKPIIGYYQNFYATFSDEEQAMIAVTRIIEADNAQVVKIELKTFEGDPKSIKTILSNPNDAGVWGKTGRTFFP